MLLPVLDVSYIEVEGDPGFFPPIIVQDSPLPQRVPTKQQIKRFETELLKCEGNLDVDSLTAHYFTPGVYGREILIPAGNFIVGKTHKDTNMNILLCGKLTVWTEDGMKTLEGPQIIIGQPGTKRIGYAWTDTRWLCIHGVPVEMNNTDHLDALESLLIEPESQIEYDLDKLREDLKLIEYSPK